MNKPDTLDNPNGRLTLRDVLRMLINDGMLDKIQAEKLYKDRKLDSSNLHPLVVVAEQKWKNLNPPHKALTVEALSGWLAEHAGLDYHPIDPLKLDFGSAAKIITQAYAERLKIMPIAASNGIATIATTEPFSTEWISDLERVLKMKIKLVMANPLEISRYLPEIYNLASSMNAADLAKAGQIVGVQNFEQLIELGKDKNLDANEQHVVNIVDWLFKYAFEQRASDIHLEPRRNIGIMRFRIDGILHQVYQLPPNIMNAITSRIKLLGRMDMVEKRRPQDGRIKTLSAEGQEIELRLSTMPTAFGEKMVMRIFTPAGIRTLMRQDPDIIMIGEIRDLETADMAIQAALTGHLVLSTLHTNDAPSAITRLLDLGVPSYLIHSTVLGIMAQRLVRTLCTHCKVQVPIAQSQWDALIDTFKLPKPAHIYKPVGCIECRNTGFKGRSGIYEMFTMTPALRKLITPETDLARLTKLARFEGMQPLIINGAEKVAAGVTTIEELLKVAPPLASE